MNDQPKKPKGTRTKLRDTALMLQAALNQSEAVMKSEPSELTIAKIKLAQVRVTTLNKMLARAQRDRTQALDSEVTRLTAENERLKREREAEAQQGLKPTTQVLQPMSDIDRVLAQYEAEKASKNLNDEIAKKLQRIKNGGSETETQPVASMPVMPVTPLPSPEIADQERERIADLEEKSRQQELKRKRDALDYAERMAAVDRENAELDEKLSKLGSKYYTPSTTSALL